MSHDKIRETMPKRISDDMQERTPERARKNVSERVPRNVADQKQCGKYIRKMLETVPQNAGREAGQNARTTAKT